MLSEAHPHPGRLVVEGIDGSGKSTQLALLHRWLASQGYKVFFTEWHSAALVRRSIGGIQDLRRLISAYLAPKPPMWAAAGPAVGREPVQL